MSVFCRRRLLSFSALGLAGLRAEPPKSGWLSLIAGPGLTGWRAQGAAIWSVEDGAIVGRQGPDAKGGDLFTEKQWSDFELEAEWRMRWPGNSGIWFRVTGPRTGYQADILDDEPGYPGVLSGSLYCMGKAFIAQNRDPATVRKEAWNRVYIRAAGSDIIVEQNGRRVVQVRDDTFLSAGSIGIQVHTGKAFAGMEARVRNLRLRPL